MPTITPRRSRMGTPTPTPTPRAILRISSWPEDKAALEGWAVDSSEEDDDEADEGEEEEAEEKSDELEVDRLIAAVSKASL